MQAFFGKKNKFENIRFPLSAGRYSRVVNVPMKIFIIATEESEGDFLRTVLGVGINENDRQPLMRVTKRREENFYCPFARIREVFQVPGEILSSIEREKSVTGRGKQNGGLYPCPRTEEGLGIVSVHCFPNKRRPRCFVRRYVQPDRQDEQEMDCCQFYSS